MENLLVCVKRKLISCGHYGTAIVSIFYFSFRELFASSHVVSKVILLAIQKQVQRIAREGLIALTVVALLTGLLVVLQVSEIASSIEDEKLLETIVVMFLLRELGPLLVAFLVAGQASVIISMDIWSLRVGMQLQSLEAMGIRPMGFVVLPRMIAVLVVMIGSVGYFTLLAVTASMISATLVLEISFEVFIDTLLIVTNLSDFGVMFMKSVIFGLIVAGVCCHHGFLVRDARDGVLHASVLAILSSVVICVLLDSFVNGILTMVSL